jgi:hypothetical protein
MHGNASIVLCVEFASITLCWCNKQKKVYKKGQGGSLTPRHATFQNSDPV